MLKLIKTETRRISGEERPVRIYKNSLTESELITFLLRKDIFGNSFWAFEDLFSIPFIRQSAAKKVLDLYGHGLHLDDIKKLTGEAKIILKATGPDKYEQAFAKILELENLSETLGDPVKQCLGLCTVYLLFNDEVPDVWNNTINGQKMTAMTNDPDSQAFFLSWWIDTTKGFGNLLKGLSQIASTISSEQTNGVPSL